MSRVLSVLMLALGAALFGCGQPGSGAPRPSPSATTAAPQFRLTSSAFKNGEPIPIRYTADGDSISPPLTWSGAPTARKDFALIMDDPDAPREIFTHWVIYGMPVGLTSLPEGLPTTETLPALGGARQGTNSARSIGYTPPSPPPGKVHHYLFRLYALDALVTLPPGVTATELRKAMDGHVLATADLTGTYQRTR